MTKLSFEAIYMTKKIILVTGGAGFVGSRLCARLVEMGHTVISLDNYFTGSRDNHCEGVDWREGGTKDIATLVPENVDIIYHLGEYSRVEQSLLEPDLVWRLNTEGTFAVLEYWRARGCKLVYAGSSSKFSDGGLGRDLSPYTWTKATNTELVRNYSNWYGLPYAITYFYNVYGDGEIAHGPYSTLIAIFKQETRHGQPLTVVSPGTQMRNFTHIDDTIEGLLLVGEKGENDEYGIGAQESYSVLDVAKMFLNGREEDEIVMLPERGGNRMTSNTDTSKIRALGWRQQVHLAEHIKEFLVSVEKTRDVEKRILVFSTTFYPVEGLAEKALRDVMAHMPEVQFDVVTAAFSEEAKNAPSPLANVTVHRVGKGAQSDKYRLPFLGAAKAKELSSAHSYLFFWGVLASYGTLAAIRAKRHAQLPLLITLADQKLASLPLRARFLMRFILGEADQISASDSTQEKVAARFIGAARFSQNRMGDVFANQLRFLYNATLKGLQKSHG